jgi:hypothetical protein
LMKDRIYHPRPGSARHAARPQDASRRVEAAASYAKSVQTTSAVRR